MINEAQNTQSPFSVENLKDHGREAYAPLVKLVHKYQDEFVPYLESLAKGFRAGAEALKKDDAKEVDKYVSYFFEETSKGLDEACSKLHSQDFSELSGFITNLAEKKPSVMFGASYITGIFFGRLGKHMMNKNKNEQSLH